MMAWGIGVARCVDFCRGNPSKGAAVPEGLLRPVLGNPGCNFGSVVGKPRGSAGSNRKSAGSSDAVPLSVSGKIASRAM